MDQSKSVQCTFSFNSWPVTYLKQEELLSMSFWMDLLYLILCLSKPQPPPKQPAENLCSIQMQSLFLMDNQYSCFQILYLTCCPFPKHLTQFLHDHKSRQSTGFRRSTNLQKQNEKNVRTHNFYQVLKRVHKY